MAIEIPIDHAGPYCFLLDAGSQFTMIDTQADSSALELPSFRINTFLKANNPFQTFLFFNSRFQRSMESQGTKRRRRLEKDAAEGTAGESA